MQTTISSTSMSSRHAMGAVYGYYKSNQGTREGLQFWEEQLEKNLSDLSKLNNLYINSNHSNCRNYGWIYEQQKFTKRIF